jgi:hypothetical protein
LVNLFIRSFLFFLFFFIYYLSENFKNGDQKTVYDESRQKRGHESKI